MTKKPYKSKVVRLLPESMERIADLRAKLPSYFARLEIPEPLHADMTTDNGIILLALDALKQHVDNQRKRTRR